MILAVTLASMLLNARTMSQELVVPADVRQEIALPEADSREEESGRNEDLQQDVEALMESIKVAELLQQARAALDADRYPEAAAAYAISFDFVDFFL